MVFVRYVLNQTTIWQTDFTTWSLVAATFIGSPYLLLNRGHVNVDVLPLHLSPRPRWWENNCMETNNLVAVGKEMYAISADGYLMPVKKDQAPPDLRYFKKYDR